MKNKIINLIINTCILFTYLLILTSDFIFKHKINYISSQHFYCYDESITEILKIIRIFTFLEIVSFLIIYFLIIFIAQKTYCKIYFSKKWINFILIFFILSFISYKLNINIYSHIFHEVHFGRARVGYSRGSGGGSQGQTDHCQRKARYPKEGLQAHPHRNHQANTSW